MEANRYAGGPPREIFFSSAVRLRLRLRLLHALLEYCTVQYCTNQSGRLPVLGSAAWDGHFTPQ